MSIENLDIERYILNLSKKSVTDFYNHINEKNSGHVSHMRHDLINSSNLSMKEINYLLEFSILNNIINISDDYYESKNILSIEKFFIELCSFYFNSVYSNEKIFLNIFQKSKISLEDDFILINLNSVNIRYTPILTTLSKLGFLKYKGNDAYVRNLALANKLLERPLRKIKKSLKDFEKEQYEKSERGKMAEIFVLNHEMEKLKNTIYKPTRISVEDVGAGYDILSFEINGDKKYIEVKSISQDRFFWSKNEVDNSKILKDNYFIYCVKFDDGKPTEILYKISNPYKEIFIDKKYRKKSIEDYIIYLH